MNDSEIEDNFGFEKNPKESRSQTSFIEESKDPHGAQLMDDDFI